MTIAKHAIPLNNDERKAFAVFVGEQLIHRYKMPGLASGLSKNALNALSQLTALVNEAKTGKANGFAVL